MPTKRKAAPAVTTTAAVESTDTKPARPRTRARTQADPKSVEAAKTADTVPATVTDEPQVITVPVTTPTPAPKPPRPRKVTFGHATVESKTVRNNRAGKDQQVVTVHAAGREVVVTFTPAGKQATVTVDGAKVG